MAKLKANGFCIPYDLKVSPGKGLGVFAAADINKGDTIWRHVIGQYTVYDEPTFTLAISSMSADEVRYELTHVFGLPEFPNCVIRVFDDGALINHAEDANVVTNNAGVPGVTLDPSSASYLADVSRILRSAAYTLIATKNIRSGDELTNNYAADTCDPPFYLRLCAKYGVDEVYVEGP